MFTHRCVCRCVCIDLLSLQYYLYVYVFRGEHLGLDNLLGAHLMNDSFLAAINCL